MVPPPSLLRRVRGLPINPFLSLKNLTSYAIIGSSAGGVSGSSASHLVSTAKSRPEHAQHSMARSSRRSSPCFSSSSPLEYRPPRNRLRNGSSSLLMVLLPRLYNNDKMYLARRSRDTDRRGRAINSMSTRRVCWSRCRGGFIGLCRCGLRDGCCWIFRGLGLMSGRRGRGCWRRRGGRSRRGKRNNVRKERWTFW